MEPFYAEEGPRRGKPGERVASAEKRGVTRIVCRASVQWAYFNKHEQHHAEMLNHSDTGVYFESPFVLTPGATVLIRLEARPSSCPLGGECTWPRTFSMGDVKWCRPLVGSDAPRFGVGVKYHVAA
jgi:hypothetical protein